MKKAVIFTCLIASMLFAQEISDAEMVLFIEQMKAAMIKEMKVENQPKEKNRDLYLSAKFGVTKGEYDDYFSTSMEIGAVNYDRKLLFAGELTGGYWNWGGGLNIGVLFELGKIQYVIPGISSGFWFAMDYDEWDYRFVLGGPFVKYLVGKNGKFFEISAKANMGWTEIEERYSYGSGYWDWNYRYKNKFLINANIRAGLTFLF